MGGREGGAVSICVDRGERDILLGIMCVNIGIYMNIYKIYYIINVYYSLFKVNVYIVVLYIWYI